ncbi:hypothetical protein [Legionella quateirensis]|uniref:Dot/Icm secretion system substrate n=1 Tax=Legionella quateirensis TaxID=45072 RepID=A0A378KQ21_9GAMM|nr:hypothetical protein [Legionella quateirensis]KTD52834.1 substrate of the Dot/Icm secretion system [Legionella quateirensis]STY16436.1 Dot/Icm secretion system substrate [Legionella quateirensis]
MSKKPLPPKEILLQGMRLTGNSIPGARYFAQQFRQLLIDTKMLEECRDIMEKVDEYADFVYHKLTPSNNYWFGDQKFLTDFQNMQENLATAAAQRLAGTINSSINLDIAFGNFGELLRGYSAADGRSLSTEQIGALDTLLNAWFSKQNNVSKGSKIYEADNNGEVVVAANGKQVNADPEDLKAIITDPELGCESFMEEKGIPVTVQLHEYPEEQIVAEKATVVEKAPEVRREPAVGKEEGLEIEPTIEPSTTGMSSGG